MPIPNPLVGRVGSALRFLLSWCHAHQLTVQRLDVQDAPATPVASTADVDMGAEKAEATITAAQESGAAEPMETEASAAGASATNGQTA